MGNRAMDSWGSYSHPSGDEDDGRGIVELPVLLTDRQLAALEEAAHEHGLTTAQLLRRILWRYLECERRGKGGGTR